MSDLKNQNEANNATAKRELFFLALMNHDYDKIESALAAGEISPNAKNRDGNSLLHLAVGFHDIPMVELLLKHKANPNEPNRNHGSTPLHIAITTQNEERNIDLNMLTLLLQNGASPDIQNKYHLTPLMMATKANDVNAVHLLAEKSQNINISDDYKDHTALKMAREQKNPVLARVLEHHSNQQRTR